MHTNIDFTHITTLPYREWLYLELKLFANKAKINFRIYIIQYLVKLNDI